MQDKLIYEYATIKLVPKVERGEFLNVGVILLSKNIDYLGMRYHLDAERLSIFSSDIDIDSIRKYLSAWEWICEGNANGGHIGKLPTPERFRWLTAARSTIIQSSQVHPGLCTDPKKKLADLYSKYVLQN